MACALSVFGHELVVGKLRVRIFVEKLQGGTGGRGGQVVVILFDVLAVIAFPVGKAEEALFQDGIFFVPQRQRQANVLVAIAKSGDAVLSPAIGAGACMVMRKITPCVAIGAVIFADGAPLALGEVRAPTLPVGYAFTAGPQPLFFSC